MDTDHHYPLLLCAILLTCHHIDSLFLWHVINKPTKLCIVMLSVPGGFRAQSVKFPSVSGCDLPVFALIIGGLLHRFLLN